MNVTLFWANTHFENLPPHEKIGLILLIIFLGIIGAMILSHLLTDVASKGEIREIMREELKKFFEENQNES